LAEAGNDDQPRIRPADDRGGVVARPAVDDDVLDRPVRLRLDAGERLGDEAARIERGRNDAD
jgi:hypothetical protein